MLTALWARAPGSAAHTMATTMAAPTTTAALSTTAAPTTAAAAGHQMTAASPTAVAPTLAAPTLAAGHVSHKRPAPTEVVDLFHDDEDAALGVATFVCPTCQHVFPVTKVPTRTSVLYILFHD